MKKLLFILSISLFTITAFSQGIYNNGAYIVTTSSANIYVDGGTSGGYISAGTSYVQGNASSTLTLEGNFTNNSSTTGFINPNNVTTVFNADAQNIGGSASTTFGKVELPSSQGFISYPIYIYNKDIIENMDAILEELRNLFQGQSVEYKLATMMTLRNGREEDISTLAKEIDSYTDPNYLRKEQQIIVDWS